MSNPEVSRAKMLAFLAMNADYPDEAFVWSSGGLEITWGDLRWLATCEEP